MIINDDNYYSFDADQAYLSCSQLKTYIDCPSRWHAQYRTGDYQRQPSDAMIRGSYVDLLLLEPEKVAQFEEDNHDALFTRKGDPRADTQRALGMVEAVRKQPVVMSMLADCDYQRILTAEVFGVPFKCKLDAIDDVTGTLIDLKTTQDINRTVWSHERACKVDWITAWDYWIQMVLYTMICEANGIEINDCHIIAVDAQSPPSVRVYDMGSNAYELARAVDTTRTAVTGIQGAMIHLESGGKLRRCEACEWCRQTYKVTRPMKNVDGTWE